MYLQLMLLQGISGSGHIFNFFLAICVTHCNFPQMISDLELIFLKIPTNMSLWGSKFITSARIVHMCMLEKINLLNECSRGLNVCIFSKGIQLNLFHQNAQVLKYLDHGQNHLPSQSSAFPSLSTYILTSLINSKISSWWQGFTF